jgi:hypothetical protein
MIENKYSEDIAATICREFERLSGDRGNEESHWQEIAERIIPAHSNTFYLNGDQSHGQKKTDKLLDSTASIALQRFAAILDSMLTPANQKWHKLTASNTDLQKDREVKKYFEKVNEVLFKYRYSPKANFTSQNQQNYLSLGAYGTGAMYVDELYGETGLRYKNIHLGEVYFSENHQGIVDKAFRHFQLTARQAIQKFGDKCPDKIKTAMDTNPEQKFWFIHACMPREDYDPNRADYKGMLFASYYIAKSDKTLVKEGGFNVFPYSISRYTQTTGEIYGRSPAMEVLPAIKTLNEEKRTLLKQGQRALDPVLLAYDDGVIDGFSLKAGAMNYGGVSADGRPLIHALPTGNIMVSKELMDDERMVINDSFLVNLFQVLTESPAMTATEVLERTKEKGILLAPTIGRQRSEYLGPMIEREIDILSRQAIKGVPLLPPMPPILREAQGEYKIEYESPLSRAQRSEEASGLMRTLEVVINAVNVTQDPAPLDNFNFDIIIPEVAEIQGVPMKWMNSPEQIAAIRGGRAQQAQIKQATEAGPAVAAVMNAGTKAGVMK